jgi:hypothetical protein
MPLAQLPQIPVVDLRSHPELVSDLGRYIEAHICHGEASLACVHGQPVVLVGVHESLRSKPMHLYGAVKDLEFLRA